MFLEETIRSVLLQRYPALQYIVVDGGSSDESVSILEKYSPWISSWVSEPDGGQAHAINKGLRIAAGEIVNFINSDDMLAPGALPRVAGAMETHDAVAGNCVNFSTTSREEVRNRKLSARHLISHAARYHQPAIWLRRRLLEECGGISDQYHYFFDWDLYIRYFARCPRVRYIEDVLSFFRFHGTSKTVGGCEHYRHEVDAILAELLTNTCDPRVRRWTRRRLSVNEWLRNLRAVEAEFTGTPWRALYELTASAVMHPHRAANTGTFQLLRTAAARARRGVLTRLSHLSAIFTVGAGEFCLLSTTGLVKQAR